MPHTGLPDWGCAPAKLHGNQLLARADNNPSRSTTTRLRSLHEDEDRTNEGKGCLPNNDEFGHQLGTPDSCNLGFGLQTSAHARGGSCASCTNKR